MQQELDGLYLEMSFELHLNEIEISNVKNIPCMRIHNKPVGSLGSPFYSSKAISVQVHPTSATVKPQETI